MPEDRSVPPGQQPGKEPDNRGTGRTLNVRRVLLLGRIWTRRALILELRVSRLVVTALRHLRPGLRYLWKSLLRRWRRSSNSGRS